MTLQERRAQLAATNRAWKGWGAALDWRYHQMTLTGFDWESYSDRMGIIAAHANFRTPY